MLGFYGISIHLPLSRLLHLLGVSADSSLITFSEDARFGAVMDSLVDFRSAVREFALTTPPSSDTEDFEAKSLESAQVKKKRKKEMQKERQSLLTACDSLRENLSAQGLQLVDQSKDRPDFKGSWNKFELNVAAQRGRKE